MRHGMASIFAERGEMRTLTVSTSIFLVGLTIQMSAQALPAAAKSTRVQIGVGASFAKPDFTDAAIKGISLYGSVDFGRHLGIDGEVHDIKLFTPRDVGESSYLLGLRYGITEGRLYPYAKVLAGLGSFSFQKGYFPSNSASTHRMYALGGGLDFRANRNINIRVIDFEFQRWPGFGPHGLTPLVATFGLAYAF
jgi:hypothetical protein